MRKTHRLWILAMLLLPAALQAQADPAGLTLPEAVQEAEAHSPYYQKAQAGEREASWGQLEAWSEGFFPQVQVKGQYFLHDPQYTRLNVQFGGPSAPIVQFPGIYPEATLALDARLDLFDGFRNLHNLDAADNRHHAAQVLSDFARFELARRVRLKFYQAIGAKELSDMADQNVKTLEDHMRIVEDQLKNGQATKYDVLRVDVQLSEAKSNQIEAHDNVVLAKESLTQALGLKKDDRPLVGELPVLDADALLAKVSDTDFDGGPELKAREMDTLAMEDRSAAAHAFWFPKVSLIGEYEWYNSPDYLATGLTDTNDFRTAYFVGAAATWDLFDGGLSVAKANEAGARADQARQDLTAAQLQAPYDFDLWKRRLSSSVALYKAKVTDVEKAKESTRLATLGFKAGTRTTTDVLDAELEQFRAQAGLVEAQLGALEALVNLELSIGKGIEHE